MDIKDYVSDEDTKTFIEAMGPAMGWFLMNCNLHQKIEISYDGVTIVSDEAFVPIDMICEE